jgi:hypothetical protein
VVTPTNASDDEARLPEHLDQLFPRDSKLGHRGGLDRDGMDANEA